MARSDEKNFELGQWFVACRSTIETPDAERPDWWVEYLGESLGEQREEWTRAAGADECVIVVRGYLSTKGTVTVDGLHSGRIHGTYYSGRFYCGVMDGLDSALYTAMEECNLAVPTPGESLASAADAVKQWDATTAEDKATGADTTQEEWSDSVSRKSDAFPDNGGRGEEPESANQEG